MIGLFTGLCAAAAAGGGTESRLFNGHGRRLTGGCAWGGDNSCPYYANDGVCDDGGPGSQHSDCATGTDCTDCGAPLPSPPPLGPGSPPAAPPPTPPARPPLGPGYVYRIPSLCQETCQYSNDGECDDGGAGSSYSDCMPGSDCTDCGTRSDANMALCTSCPQECNAAGNADRNPMNWCLENMWKYAHFPQPRARLFFCASISTGLRAISPACAARATASATRSATLGNAITTAATAV